MKRWIALLPLLLVGGCLIPNDSEGPPSFTAPFVPGQSLAALVGVEGCDQLLVELQQQSIALMEQQVDTNLAQALQYGNGWCMNDYMEDGVPIPASGTGSDPGPSERAEEYSETNTQVAGVDEADFIKNDGAYIYILADGRFQIIDAWPPEQAHLLSDFPITGAPRKLFVYGDRALIYSSGASLGSQQSGPYDYYYGGSGENYDECTYGYNCDFTGDGRALKITVLDIGDRTNPVLVREIELSGSLVNARRVDQAVFTVASFPPTALGGVTYWPQEIWNDCYTDRTDEEITALFEALKETNRQILLATTISDWIPGAVDTRYFDGEALREEGLLVSCEDFYLTQQADGQNFLSLLALDMTALGVIDVTTIFGRPGAVYASASSLYVAARHQSPGGEPWFFAEESGITEATTVHKFDLLLDKPATFYAGSGVVKGRVLNQFAMDEWNGNLRIATTTGHLPSPDVHSTLTVLEENGGALQAIGLLDQIAPTEDIRSVRFDGPRGFIVTFKKTDPLFAIDLSDPEHPAIQGELHIPGYSTYMHLLDQDHLLSIGYDSQDEGNFAWFQGILLQIFDISDMTQPALLHREVIGSRGSTSEAATNHLAFTYFRPRSLLAIPMVVCEGGHDGSYGTQMTFGGLMVYRAAADTGFEFLGGVPHLEPEAEQSPYSVCGNWWTDSNSYVQRSLFMDDYVFSVAANSIEIALSENPGEVLVSVPLTE
ncbi:MAG: beta-propeller domain-containing protein [Bradymonadales bacterium]|nr:beta-propeller domain-containing protein [Bradymonadales bacterium]